MPQPNTPRPDNNTYALVIFDLDGTLTGELLDFPAIRREIGLPEKAPILEHLAALPPAQMQRAQVILHRHELAAADACVLHAGAAELLAALKTQGLRTAILTRNSAFCARRVLRRHRLVVDFVATREDTPHKPHRDSILNISRRWGILPEQTLMVGDYLYDMQAAANAGTASALLCMKPGPLPEFAALATYVVYSLAAVLDLVRNSSGSDPHAIIGAATVRERPVREC